jgi:hypothetical protein
MDKCSRSTWRPRIPIIALSRLRVIVHLYFPLRRRVYEAFSCPLPVPACLTDTGTVSPALEEDTTDDQEAIDGQVYYQNKGNVYCKQDARPNETERSVSDD